MQAIAEEARKQEIAFEGHVPDAVRAADMSNAGMHSFEHLIGVFEGSSPLEGEFLKGGKSEAKFLASYDAERAAEAGGGAGSESNVAMSHAGVGARRELDRRDGLCERCAREVCAAGVARQDVEDR